MCFPLIFYHFLENSPGVLIYTIILLAVCNESRVYRLSSVYKTYLLRKYLFMVLRGTGFG